MARKKRTSPAVGRATKRAAALASIDPVLDLGNGLTLSAYNAAIKSHSHNVEQYNTDPSNLDVSLTNIKANEKALDALSTRMLKGVASKFGEDSDQYEKAGGKRTSERARPKRKAAAAASK
jgi:hypothetical protein